MNIATTIALGLIAAFVLYVIYVRVFANKSGRIDISAPDQTYSFGDNVDCQITITALRACRVNNLRAELHYNRRKMRNKSSTDRESLMYLAEADITVDQDWQAGQSETFDVALRMPKRGELKTLPLRQMKARSARPFGRSKQEPGLVDMISKSSTAFSPLPRTQIK